MQARALELAEGGDSIVKHFCKIAAVYGYCSSEGTVVFRRTALPLIVLSLCSLLSVDGDSTPSRSDRLARIERKAAMKHATTGDGNENSTFISARILEDLIEGLARLDNAPS